MKNWKKLFLWIAFFAVGLGFGTFGKAVFAETITFSNPIGTDEITSFFQSIIQRFQGIIAILAILFLVISGITYLTSGGSKKESPWPKPLLWPLFWALLLPWRPLPS